MRPSYSATRRAFMKSAAAATAASGIADASANTAAIARVVGPNDRVRIATVGMGIIGFIDTDCALKVPGVELVAVSDVYEGRRTHAKEVYGDRVDASVDYREVLSRKDVDAVLLCVPDHWHAKMSIDAMRAGKAVYCEKPMVRTLEEGPAVIELQRQTGRVFQVGSQFASSVVFAKLKEMLAAGAIGKLHAVEARYNRNSALGAWQYSIPTDASPETVDWDRFLGTMAPRRPFSADRFFRWRKYWDYGTAVAGDLFVHLLTAIHVATSALGPTRIAAMGGQRYWHDGREVYDLIMGLLDYPETEAHPAFTLALQTDFEDGSGENSLFRFVGSDGVIDVTFEGLKLRRVGISQASADQILRGYNSVTTFSKAQQEAFAAKLAQEKPSPKPAEYSGAETFDAPKGYDARYDHFVRFFRSIREGKPVEEDAVFGYRAAAPALLCNESYCQGRMIGWDPVAMRAAK